MCIKKGKEKLSSENFLYFFFGFFVRGLNGRMERKARFVFLISISGGKLIDLDKIKQERCTECYTIYVFSWDIFYFDSKNE